MMEPEDDLLSKIFHHHELDEVFPFTTSVDITDLKTLKQVSPQTALCYSGGQLLLALLAQQNIPCGFIGGLGCDLHYGQFTREHNDLDIAIIETPQNLELLNNLIKKEENIRLSRNILKVRFPIFNEDRITNIPVDVFLLNKHPLGSIFFNMGDVHGVINVGKDTESTFTNNIFGDPILNVNALLTMKNTDSYYRPNKAGHDMHLLMKVIKSK